MGITRSTGDDIDPLGRRLARQITRQRLPPVAVFVPRGRQDNRERGGGRIGEQSAGGFEMEGHERRARIERIVRQGGDRDLPLHQMFP